MPLSQAGIPLPDDAAACGYQSDHPFCQRVEKGYAPGTESLLSGVLSHLENLNAKNLNAKSMP